MEKKAYEEQQIGLEREARTKQADAIHVSKRHEEIARTEAKLRRLNRKNEYVEHKEVQEAFDKHPPAPATTLLRRGRPSVVGIFIRVYSKISRTHSLWRLNAVT